MITQDDKTIKELIKQAYNEKVWIPEFQRPFVWERSQIRLLVDSLYQNFTISSILIWKGKDELARRRVGGSIRDIKIPNHQKSNESVIYLLDGQQRTTALTYVFTDKKIYYKNNKKPMKSLNIYWDSEYNDDEPESRWVFEDETVYTCPESEEHFTIKDLEEKGELYKKFKTRFVKIKHAMEENINSLLTEEMFENELEFLRFSNEYQKKIYVLKETILNRKVIEIEQTGELEKVLEVFERINTKNTKLSIFDIMVAKTYTYISDEHYFTLRDYIKIITNEATYVDNDYIKNLDTLDLDNYKNPYDDATLLFLIMVSLEKKFKATQILKIKTEKLMSNIKSLHGRIRRTKEILINDFFIEYKEINKYQPISKFLVAFISEFEKEETKYKDFLKKWFWNTVIYNRYPGAQNERIAKDFNRVKNNIQSDINNALIEMQADNSRSFDYIEKSSLDNLQLFDCSYQRKSSQLYKTMLLVLKSNDVKDFRTGEVPRTSGTKKTKLEVHHIFPLKSKVGKEIINTYKGTKEEDIINNIANLSLITKETNKFIDKKDPSIYILEIEEEFRKKDQIDLFHEYMKSQFITKNMIELLKENNFEEFILERTKQIHKHLIKLTKF